MEECECGENDFMENLLENCKGDRVLWCNRCGRALVQTFSRIKAIEEDESYTNEWYEIRK